MVGVNIKIVRFCKLSMETLNNASVKNKVRRNTVAADSNMKRNIPQELLLAVAFLYSTYFFNRLAEQSRLWISPHTELRGK